jgi:Phytanoyl-CoA dioxygenase (PhyH)
VRELTQDEVSSVRQQGYVIARSVLADTELAAVHRELEDYFPSWVDHCSSPDEIDLTPAGRAVPGSVEFPFTGAALNAIGTSPVLRRNAERILGQRLLFLEQSLLWAKYAGGPNDVDQQHHCDYVDHTLLYPTARSEYGHVSTILYYTDVTAADGPTGVVSTTVSDDRILWPARYSREDWPELYAAEELVTVPAGSILVYTMRTFHRGTRIHRRSARIVHFVDFCVADRPWMGLIGWPRLADTAEWARFMSTASPDDLAAFGVPPPGDPYWDAEALEGVGRRYPDLDLSPYQAAAARR